MNDQFARAHRTADLAELHTAMAGLPHSAVETAGGPVRSAFQQRMDMRRRDKVFNEYPGLFFDPCWAMLLELVGENMGRSVPITGLTAMSGVPASTALRWIGVLEQRGLIARVPHPADKRSRLVRLTEQGRTLMIRYFDACQH